MINPMNMQLQEVSKEKENIFGINLDFMTKSIANDAPISTDSSKKTTKKKKLENGDDIFVTTKEQTDTPMIYSNVPYETTYNETNNLLKSTIGQVDILSNDVKQDLDLIRASKTLKGKYNYIPAMATTLAGLLNTKLSAIKEMNDSITNSHNLDLKRVKEVKIAQAASKEDDDKYIMDMYNAFISAPMSGSQMSMSPSMSDMTVMSPTDNIIRANVGNVTEYDAGYDNYVRTMSPEQRAMRYETDPNVKTVVVYNQSTGARYFDVVDMRTQQSVPGVPKPDAMFLENLTLDTRNNIARDINLNRTYEIVNIGGPITELY